MSVDPSEIRRNVETDLILKKARQYRQPPVHVPLPGFAVPYAPAARGRAMKESPRMRGIVAEGVLTSLEQRGWPTARISELGGEHAHNSRWAGTTLSGEQEWRQFLGVVDLAEVRRIGRLLAVAPNLFVSPSKPTKRTGRLSAADEDAAFMDALKGDV